MPGQGAVKTGMSGWEKLPGMQDESNEFVKIKKRHFFGICVGMQLLAELSEENGIHQGFGWIKGKAAHISYRAGFSAFVQGSTCLGTVFHNF